MVVNRPASKRAPRRLPPVPYRVKKVHVCNIRNHMARLVREVVDDHEQDDGNEQDGCHEEKDDEYEEQDGGDEEQDGGDEEPYEEPSGWWPPSSDEESDGQTLENVAAALIGPGYHEVQVRDSDDDYDNLYAACYGPGYSDDEVQLDDDPLRGCIFREVLARPRVRTPQQDGCPLSAGDICFYARRYAQVLIAPNSADSIDTETLRRRLAVRLSQAMMAVHPPLGSWTQNSSGVWTQNSSSSQLGSA